MPLITYNDFEAWLDVVSSLNLGVSPRAPLAFSVFRRDVVAYGFPVDDVLEWVERHAKHPVHHLVPEHPELEPHELEFECPADGRAYWFAWDRPIARRIAEGEEGGPLSNFRQRPL